MGRYTTDPHDRRKKMTNILQLKFKSDIDFNLHMWMIWAWIGDKMDNLENQGRNTTNFSEFNIAAINPNFFILMPPIIRIERLA